MSKKDEIKTTAESLMANEPEAAKALIAQGFEQGAEAERSRIQAVESACMPGHEDLIASLKFDGKTTGGEAAQQVVEAEKGSRVAAAKVHRDEAPAAVNHTEAPEGVDTGSDMPGATTEEKAQSAWDKDSALQAEFGGNFDAYLAYAQADANGSVRIRG